MTPECDDDCAVCNAVEAGFGALVLMLFVVLFVKGCA